MAKNQYKESFMNWLGIKGWILLALVVGTITFFLGKGLIKIPLRTYHYLDIGLWGVLVGGLIMFVILNIAIGIISTVGQLDIEEIIPYEIAAGVICIFTMVFTIVPLIVAA